MTIHKSKPAQLNTTNIRILYNQARVDGCSTDKEIAIWIIARSEYWKHKGYNEIVKELNDIDE